MHANTPILFTCRYGNLREMQTDNIALASAAGNADGPGHVESTEGSSSAATGNIYRPGWAPIKSQYLRPAPSQAVSNSNSSSAAEDAINGDGPANASSFKQQHGGKNKQKHRGQNKGRTGDELGFNAGAGFQLCRQYRDPAKCKFGPKCRDSHDVKAFLANKPADLGPRCPVLDALGYCPSGLNCRYGDRHMNRETGELTAPTSAPVTAGDAGAAASSSSAALHAPVKAQAESNYLRPFVAWHLKKTTYPFKAAQPFLQRWTKKPNKSVQQQQQGGNKHKQPRLEISAPGATAAASGAADAAAASAAATPAEAPTPDQVVDGPDASAAMDRDYTSGDDVDGSPAGDGAQCAPAAAAASSAASSSSAPAATATADPQDDDTYDARHRSEKDVIREGRWRGEEKKKVDLDHKIFIAPLTTVGNLPFRRLLKTLGADITCGEMAMASNLVAGNASEWALLRRHPSEDVFGVQLAGCHVDSLSRAAELIANECEVDFVDLNCGCPLDLVCNKGMGAGIMGKAGKLRDSVLALDRVLPCPVSVKMRTGLDKDKDARFAHKLIGKMRLWSAAGSSAVPEVKDPWDWSRDDETRPSPVAWVTVHGRTRQQRYSSYADWDYIRTCVGAASGPVTATMTQLRGESSIYDITAPSVVRQWGMPPGTDIAARAARVFGPGASGDLEVNLRPAPLLVVGNGDILSYGDWERSISSTGVSTCLLARGVLVKPWLCTEIKEKRDWDISSKERLEQLQQFCNYGLEHWGSDQSGVNHTRRFLLELLSFTHRYIPIGVLERLPQRMGDRPPYYVGRDDLETLMASPNAQDWVRITEMLLGPVPSDFRFVPKHKSNSYTESDEGRGMRGGVSAASMGHGKRGRDVDDDEAEG